MQAQLIPLSGGKPIDIVNDITLVGRKRGLCDLIIDRGSVSKLHCLIVKTDGLLFIRDLGSTNGTKVNGQRVTRGALLPNDELAFAGAKYRVHLGPGDPPAEPREQTEMLDSEDSDGFSEYPESGRRMEIPAAEFDESEVDDDIHFFNDQNDSESDVRLLSDDSLE
jgi:pSer/pThr/pTyr-binding forkhead associated (FHA) protein